MRQQSSQHKQVLKAAKSQTWKITYPFANTNTRNKNFQPREPSLHSIHNTIFLPYKAFMNSIPYSKTNLRILNKMSQFNWLFPHSAWDLMVMEQLFSDSRSYSQIWICSNQPVHYTKEKSRNISGHGRIRLSWLNLFYFNHYYDCKKRYSISLTLVFDVNKKFTSYLAGYPGSCHNSYVFSNMQIAHQPEKFFKIIYF
ncbi:hypothetical protein VP01_853g5 [Puccinia sorghi]|uniref:DDE Tnp4 domain-containing protein n=1 Tax=Puccinia sorghi TaxID=27349 RepID=A0A0L6U961_9BASI|nr:hypothetical protein VP01_853g5 [Puccinia sorghi]